MELWAQCYKDRTFAVVLCYISIRAGYKNTKFNHCFYKGKSQLLLLVGSLSVVQVFIYTLQQVISITRLIIRRIGYTESLIMSPSTTTYVLQMSTKYLL
jgi:hypothetical protein